MTFFDKMSCRRARVKIKIGMVTFSHPCVCVYHAVVVRKFSAALVVLRRTTFVDSKQTDDGGLDLLQRCTI